jgi:wyosine [tRNA(Phe)-imidazoG37] synthetase (radical SAM superfamily)
VFVFGPIRSRRLGRSLGVNNVPYKTCSYSCVYCQLGRTTTYTVERRCFYDWREVVGEVIGFLRRFGSEVDYVTLVPGGEPTLDACIGKIIEGIKKEASVRVAVLTNASLLWLDDVKSGIMEADYISVKVDAVSEDVWKAVNRPHPVLKLGDVLSGIIEFSRGFRGVLVSETMLVHGVNTGAVRYEEVARYLKNLNLRKAFIAIPVRPPAEPYVEPPQEREVVEAYEVFSHVLGSNRVELLNTPEPPPDRAYGDPEAWLLSTASVHPLRYEHAVKALEKVSSNPEEVIESLVKKNLVVKIHYAGTTYLLRNFRKAL